MMASIFPRDVVSIAFLSSRTKFPYSALWLIKMVPGFMAALPVEPPFSLHEVDSGSQPALVALSRDRRLQYARAASIRM